MGVSLSSRCFVIRNTLDFWFSPTRDAQAAKSFFLATLAASHTAEPRVINVEKNAAYPKAFNELKAGGKSSESCERAPASHTSTT